MPKIIDVANAKNKIRGFAANKAKNILLTKLSESPLDALFFALSPEDVQLAVLGKIYEDVLVGVIIGGIEENARLQDKFDSEVDAVNADYTAKVQKVCDALGLNVEVYSTFNDEPATETNG